MGRAGAAVRKSLREISTILMAVLTSKAIDNLICVSHNLAVEVTMDASIHYALAHLLIHAAAIPPSVERPGLAAGAFRHPGT